MKRSSAFLSLTVLLCLCFGLAPFSYSYADDSSGDSSFSVSGDLNKLSSGLPNDGSYSVTDISEQDSSVAGQVKSLTDSVLTLEAESFEYTGKALTPHVDITYEGKLLVEGKDYRISYRDNVTPGPAVIDVDGLGDFAGSAIHKSFYIVRSEGNLIALPGIWAHDDCGWWYSCSNGEYPKDCIQIIDGVSYRFDNRGYLLTNWYQLNGQWYYSRPDGAIATGWTLVSGCWYYLDPQMGCMQTGWLSIGSRWYYLDSSGSMRTGWLQLGGMWYWLDASGVMAQDWSYVGGRWYYFAFDGAMRSGWVLVDGDWFFLSDSGSMVTGWLKKGAAWYYLKDSGQMTEGRCAVSGASYVFSDSGAMQTGWIKFGDGWLFASPDGSLRSGWLKEGSFWYWLDPLNEDFMAVGIHSISGSLYRFEDNGHMTARAWFALDDGRAAHASSSGAIDLYATYNEDGRVVCLSGSNERYLGWEKLANTWFYFDSDGLFVTGWKYIGGSWYYFYSDGSMATGWVYADDKWYFLGDSGAMVTGWKTVDGHYYQFGLDGALREAEAYATTELQRRLVSACYSVPTPGPGLCSEWVAQVFARIGQGQKLPNNDYDADDMFYAYCGYSDLSQLRVGMIIAVPSHTHTHAGSIWGHICIYVGNNTVMDNVGRIRSMALDEWLSYYTTTYSPQWGWYNHYALE